MNINLLFSWTFLPWCWTVLCPGQGVILVRELVGDEMSNSFIIPPLLLSSIRCSGEPRHSHTLIRPPVTLMDHFFWLIINSLVNNIAPSSAIFHGPPLFFVKSWGVLHWTLGPIVGHPSYILFTLACSHLPPDPSYLGPHTAPCCYGWESRGQRNSNWSEFSQSGR